MELFLTVLGFLGLGALLIAAFVFVGAAKRYISGDDLLNERDALESDFSPYIDRPADSIDRAVDSTDRVVNSINGAADSSSHESSESSACLDVSNTPAKNTPATASTSGGAPAVAPETRKSKNVGWLERSLNDRRKRRGDNLFPLTINGEVIYEDRRRNPERRSLG